MRRLVLGWLAVGALLAACAPAAAPARAPAAAAPAAPAAAAAAAPAATDAAAYRQKVIDGARAEGMAHILLSSIWTDEALRLVENAVEREYGVRLKIERTPSTNYPVHAAQLMSELQANATPSYDLHQSSDSSSSLLIKADALEPWDWAAIVPAGTPPEVIQGENRVGATYTGYQGLWYDPAVVPAGEAPRSLKEFANPRWRGRIMLAQYPDQYVPYVLKWGRQEALGTLRTVMQNGTLAGTYFDIGNRFGAKEIAMGTVSSIIFASMRQRGMPGEFTLFDFAIDSAHHVSVPRKAAHPNAAKLIAAILVGPEGQRIAAEHIGAGNRYYTGSSEHRLAEQAKAMGLPPFSWWTERGAMDYLVSPEGEEVRREINAILQGG
jgi:ABC-type Fe3+ transport system substrate-binding protein